MGFGGGSEVERRVRSRARWPKAAPGRRSLYCALNAAKTLPLAGLCLATAALAQHPEWGPEPPVAPFGLDPLPSERVVHPLIFPVLGPSRWIDGFGELRGKFLHTGIDIRAAKMTPIVAPISGTLGMKTESFWIYEDDGWAVLGTHLNDDNPGQHDHAGDRDVMFAPGLVAGQHVHSGQFLGYVGESGDATAPHLHFEIYVPGAGRTEPRIRDPFPSLKAAKVISAPVVFQPLERPPKGCIRIQGCVRKVDALTHRLTVIVAAKQYPSGVTTAVTQVRFLRVTVPNEVAASAGGWDGLARIGPTRIIGLILPDSPKPDEATVSQIIAR
jgi:murein DD-endopeptidase MepM/ murein hydrolase activator NlpD